MLETHGFTGEPEYMKNRRMPELIYEEAITFKPQILEQEYLLESAFHSLKIAKSGYYPRLSLNASYGNYYYRFNGLENISFSDQWQQNSRKTVGITLSVPIFNRFQVRNNVRNAKSAFANQELAIIDTRQTLYKEIRQAYANVIAAQKVFLSSKVAVTSSHKSYQFAEESYDVGRISVFEYSEAKTRYIQSMSEQKQATFDLIFRCKILDFYHGKPIVL